MPKIIKHQPDQHVQQTINMLQQTQIDADAWPGPDEERWFRKQDGIPLKVNSHPTPAPSFVQKRDGKVVYFEYAHDGGRGVLEERVRGRTIRYLRSRPGTKLDGADWNAFAVESIEKSCQEALQELDLLIEVGNQQAAGLLGFMAREMVERVIAISNSHAAALKVVAENSMNWPVLRGKKASFDDGDQFLKPLRVGEGLPFSEQMESRIPGAKHKEMMKLAYRLLCRLDVWRKRERGAIHWGKCFVPPTKAEERAVSLPKFSKESWKIWAESAWNILLEENNQQPEMNPKLQRFGAYRKQHTAVTTELPSGKLPSGRSPKTHIANIRDGIKKRLQDAVKRCVAMRPN